MHRKEFIKLSAGIIGGLGIPGVFRPDGFAAGGDSANPEALDKSYLERGLAGMAQSQGWFEAHWGAAVIAGYYLCKENPLGNETVSDIRNQLDTMIRLQPEQFAPMPESPADESLIDQIPAALKPAVEGGLRAHGHAVIYASLSVKALREVPHMAQRNLIDKLCGHSRQIARKAPEKPENPTAYSDSQAMVEALFNSLARFEPLVGYPSVMRPNFTHMTTHTEALMNLEAMGYPDIARAGHLGHQAHLAAPVPEFDSAGEPKVETAASLEGIIHPNYWENEENLDRWSRKWAIGENPNGYWVAFGHLFKMLYAYHRLVRRIEDREKVLLCSRVLLERYFNPSVQGG
ncbi:MAG: hypothetical protein KDM63_11730 [Verrucomicrobiae bacterium]|nr:hypothetical protein [Verrucomicrobiae bacterium]